MRIFKLGCSAAHYYVTIQCVNVECCVELCCVGAGVRCCSDLFISLLNHTTGNCVEAFSKYGESLDVMRRVYGADHPSVADTLKNQANVHEMLGYVLYGVCVQCILFVRVFCTVQSFDGTHSAQY